MHDIPPSHPVAFPECPLTQTPLIQIFLWLYLAQLIDARYISAKGGPL